MKKSIKGTQTEKNLVTAFMLKSYARMQYVFYAKQAKSDGYDQISALFEEIVFHDMVLGKRIYRHLEGGNVEITTTLQAGVIGDTVENLTTSISEKNREWAVLYPQFAEIAEQEGFSSIASSFRLIAKANATHEEMFSKHLDRVKNGTFFEREEETEWYCRHCGYVHVGKRAPKTCPACMHPQSYFEAKNNAYY